MTENHSGNHSHDTFTPAELAAEEWRAVVGYEGAYAVSDLGRVRSVTRRNNNGNRLQGRMLAPCNHRQVYRMISLARDGRRRQVTVHSIAAESFLGPRPAGLDVLHRDGVNANNRRDNLLYGDQHQARAISLATGRRSPPLTQAEVNARAKARHRERIASDPAYVERRRAYRRKSF